MSRSAQSSPQRPAFGLGEDRNHVFADVKMADDLQRGEERNKVIGPGDIPYSA